jgi:hypothetical protein
VKQLTAAFLALVLMLTASLGCNRENEHLERARKQMERGQWANARTALGQALKQDAKDLQARAMLLYCLDREEGLQALIDFSLYSLFVYSLAARDPSAARASKRVRSKMEDELADARKTLFDRGLDTKDIDDLAKVALEAARYGHAHHEEQAREPAELATLAVGGDGQALARLVDLLKGQDPIDPVLYLTDVGPRAVAPLQAMLRDEAFTGRRAALLVLAQIAATERARAWLQERPELISAELSPARPVGKELLPATALSNRRGLDLWRAHGLVTLLDDDSPDHALVLLQAWDDSKGEVALEPHAFADQQLRKLALVDRDHRPIASGRELFHKVLAVRGGVELHRRREHPVSIEVDAGVVARPAPGLRVRLRGHDARGEIVREDQGLWIVKLDAPMQGMTELPASSSSLIRLVPQDRTETLDETLTARIEGQELRVISSESTPVSDGDARR